MKVWPVPKSYKKSLPEEGEPGSFWEDRGDRFHCGIDILAPEGSEVLAMENGYVIDKGIFTSPEMSSYLLKTYYVIIKTDNKIMIKYAELKEVFVSTGDYVDVGQVIGTVGVALSPDKITYQDPYYLQEMAHKGHVSMLHLELFRAPVTTVQPYSVGNFLGDRRPESLIDPTLYLNGLARKLKKQEEQTQSSNSI